MFILNKNLALLGLALGVEKGSATGITAPPPPSSYRAETGITVEDHGIVVQFEHMGCYLTDADGEGHNLFQGKTDYHILNNDRDGHNTIGLCAAMCREKNYYALIYGFECVCSDSPPAEHWEGYGTYYAEGYDTYSDGKGPSDSPPDEYWEGDGQGKGPSDAPPGYDSYYDGKGPIDYLPGMPVAHPSECDAPCQGNSSQSCGGTWRADVYEKTLTEASSYSAVYLMED
ncbi:unnamed protein product [Chrysoparadoxa australica]